MLRLCLNKHYTLCLSNYSLPIHTDIHQRYQTSYTALCNGVVSHGFQFGGLRGFGYRTHKSKRKTNAFRIFACRAAFYACLSSGSYMQVTHALDERNPKTPKLSSLQGSRWRRFWYLSLVYICGNTSVPSRLHLVKTTIMGKR